MAALRSAKITRGVVASVFFMILLILYWRDIVFLFQLGDLIHLLRNRSGPLEFELLRPAVRMVLVLFSYIFFFLLSMFIIAQFVLPVHNWPERLGVFFRLLGYWSILFRGPTLFVRNGKLVRFGDDGNNTEVEKEEIDSGNPGIIVLDARSAAVVENKWSYSTVDDLLDHLPDGTTDGLLARLLGPRINFTQDSLSARPLGPGINFTQWGERLRLAMDLRRQVRVTSDEPITVPREVKNANDQGLRKKVYVGGVRAFTHDGIEVGANCYVVFSLSDLPDVIKVGYWGGTDAKDLCALELEKIGGGEEQSQRWLVKNTYPLDEEDAQELHRAVIDRRIAFNWEVLEPPQCPGPFPFDGERIFAAAYGCACNEILVERQLHWYELPQKITEDYYRNLLAQYDFDYLFSADRPGHLPWLDEFKRELSRRLNYQGILSCQLVIPGDSTSSRAAILRDLKKELQILAPGGFVLGREVVLSAPFKFTASKPLRDRGIKIVAAGFSDLKIPPQIRVKMVERWQARWDRELHVRTARVEREVMQVIGNARARAQRDNAYWLASIFRDERLSTEALALMLFQSLELAADDARNNKDLAREIFHMLQNLHNWFLREYQEMERRKKQDKLPQRPDPDTSRGEVK